MSFRDHKSLGFLAAPRLVPHRPRSGANRYVVLAAGFVLGMLAMAMFA